MELALPLAAAHTLGQRDLIGIAAVSGLGLRAKGCPAVIGKPVAKGFKQRAVVNGLPEV